jgi:N-acyl-D-amino-acid deacylase
MYDFILKNAKVYSGRNEAPLETDIAIENSIIAKIQKDIPETEGKKVVDLEGLILTPGFIDPHASTGFGYFFPNAADHKLYQGITTEIFGNCGTSPAPIGDGLLPTMERLSNQIGFPFEWRSTAEYFEKIEDKIQFNIATLVGHSTLRGGYLEDWHEVTEADQARMEEALAQAMEEGAVGMSTGLIYSPGCFAKTEEIVRLAKVMSKYDGLYASHLRSEREELHKAVDEALTIGEAANCRVLISHLKAAEQPNWGKIEGVIKKLEAYNATHEQKAWVDVYPYTAVSTKLKAFIPKEFLADGTAALAGKLEAEGARQEIADWIEFKQYHLDQMLIISNERNEAFINKSVETIAQENNWSLADAIVEILLADNDSWIVYHCIAQEDMDHAILWPQAMICTDSWSYPINAPKILGRPHPRSYGAFTQYLEDYVIKRPLLSIEEAIYKVTHLPASVFKLEKRGLIEEGYYADLVAFDWDKVKANATYLDPMQLSGGVEHLWVNGKLTIHHQKIQDQQAGQILTLKANAETI